MIERVLLDLDGVCADFHGSATALHSKKYPGYPHMPVLQREQSVWDIADVFKMSKPDLWDPMGREFWANLKPTPHMKTYVQLLEDKFGAKNICILTSPIRTDGCHDGKVEWIRKHLPKYSRRYLVGPAKAFCASPKHLLVDDSEKNTKPFKELGGQTFLVPAPWNSRFKEDPITALRSFLKTI